MPSRNCSHVPRRSSGRGQNIKVILRRSTTIREVCRGRAFSLIWPLALVVMVIFMFLRDISATTHPDGGVPIRYRHVIAHVTVRLQPDKAR